MSDAAGRRLRPGVEFALSVGAFLGLLCVVVSLCAVFFGVTPLVFRSGSMSPAIDTGAVALARTVPAADLVAGDIVSVDMPDGTRITHRIVDVVGRLGNSAELVLQGDANSVADPETYVVTEAQRVFADVPYAGYFVSWLSTPFAWGVGAVLSISLLVIAWRPVGRDGNEPKHSTGKHIAVASVALVTATATVIGVGISRSEMTLAASTDTAYASGTVAAGTVVLPLSFTCTGGGLLVPLTFSWPNKNAAYTYTLDYVSVTGGPTTRFEVGPSSADPQTFSSTQLGGLLALGNYRLTLRAKLGNFVTSGSLIHTLSRLSLLAGVVTSCGSPSSSTTAAGARSAPLVAETSTPPTAAASTAESTSPFPSTTVPPPTTTEVPPASAAVPTTTTTVPPTTTTVSTTTTTPPPPPPPPAVNLTTPSSSPSGSAVATVIDSDGSPTLQIADSAGAVQYSGPITATDEYGYGIAWASGDQLWLLGPSQLVRFDRSDSGWSRSVVDRTATDEIPADIAAQL